MGFLFYSHYFSKKNAYKLFYSKKTYICRVLKTKFIMNYKLSREIYGMTPWFVDAQTLSGMLSTLNNIRGGAILELPDEKYNSPFVFNASISSDTRVITRPYGDPWEGPGQLENNDNFDGVGVINLNGPITVSGGMSTIGMEQLSEYMLQMAQDYRIKCFIILADSGGGSAGAVSIMVDTINSIKTTKPVYGLIKKGGVACSACYGILTACNKIYSENGMSFVGSVGTMIQFEGKKANSEDRDAFQYIRLYATKSTLKNHAFEEAINNGNFKPMIDEVLNPFNENFLSMVITNRPMLSSVDFHTGRDILTKDGIGTYIDGISSFSEVVDMVIGEAKAGPNFVSNSNNNNNPNSSTMKKIEYKAAHPEEHAAIVQEGVTAERERVKSWLVYKDADPEAVAAGIDSGEEISQSQGHALMVKMNANAMKIALKGDSAKPLSTDATNTNGKEGELSEEDAAYASVDAKLGLTKKV